MPDDLAQYELEQEAKQRHAKPVPLPFLPQLQTSHVPVKAPEKEVMRNVPPMSEFAVPDLESKEYKEASTLTPTEKDAQQWARQTVLPWEYFQKKPRPPEQRLETIRQGASRGAEGVNPLIPFSENISGTREWRSPETGMEAANWLLASLLGGPKVAKEVAPIIEEVAPMVEKAVGGVGELGKVAGKVLGSERGAVGSRLAGLKSTEDAYALGKDLSKDEAKSIWEQYKARPKGAAARLSPAEMESRAFEDQMMRESVEGHVRGGKFDYREPALKHEEIDAHFDKPAGEVSDLRPAVVDKGKVVPGEVGDTHVDVIKGLKPDEANRGFIAPDGKFLNRKEAVDWMKKNQPEVYSKWQKIAKPRETELFSEQYRDAAGLKEKGITGILKSERGSLAPAPQPKGWTYPLQTAIEQKMPNSAPVEQVKGLIKGSGIKEDEIKWSGLDEFLQGKTKVDKTELMEYLKTNQVEVKEVVKGSSTSREEADAVLAQAHQDLRNRTISRHEFEAIEERVEQEMAGMGEPDISFLPADARNDLDIAYNAMRQGRIDANEYEQIQQRIIERYQGAKFSQWQLPGGENYRELLLTLPEPKEQVIGTGIHTGEKYYKEGYEPFRSAHWDEPNVLAHVRFNDRVDPEGKKVLFIEEVQSDWHQAGRERGYGQGLTVGETSEFENLEHLALSKGRDQLTEQQLNRLTSLETKNETSGGVPPAPFSKTWHEMAMRRMVRWASENGYDKIAWTTGEQQVERYDLSKQVKKIFAFDNDDGTWAIGLVDKYGNFQGMAPETESVVTEKLPNVVGKDLAEKIVKKSGRKLNAEELEETFTTPAEAGLAYEGLDLKVGGEGMKGFYDKIVPEYMNKFGKKWGAKVGETKLGETKQYDVRYIGRNTETGRHEYEVFDSRTKADRTVFEREDKPRAKQAAEEFAKEKNQTYNVHSLDITPSMKKSVLEQGLPLFQLAPPVAAGAGLAGAKVLQKKGQSEKPTVPQYKSLEEVQAAVKAGTITRADGISISKQKGWIQ